MIYSSFSMRLSTRFLLLLGFLFVGISLTVWFGVRPGYEEAILNERTTIISEQQRERIELSEQTIALWASSVLELSSNLARFSNVDQAQLLFTGFSALLPDLMGIRLIEQSTGEFLELRSSSSFRLPEMDASTLRPVGSSLLGQYSRQNNDSANLFAGWSTENDLFVISSPFILDGDPFRLTAVFDARQLEELLFSHNLGVEVASVLWLEGSNQAISRQSLPDVRPDYEPVTRFRQTLVDEKPSIIISSPMLGMNALHSLYLDPADIQGPIRSLFVRSMFLITLAFGALALATIFLFRQLASPVRTFLSEIHPFASYDFSRPFSKSAVPELHEVSVQMEEIRNKLLHYQRINVEEIILNQQKLGLMMEHATDLIAVFDKEGTFTFRNMRFVDLFLDMDQPAPGDLFSFQQCEMIKQVGEAERQQYEAEPLTVQTTRKEVVVNTSDEISYFFDLQQVELFNEDSERIGGQLILYDLTSERELDRLRNDMVNIIVHELKNPISGIKGLTNILLEDDDMDEDTVAEIYELIDSSADSLFNLVERFLQISRLESNSSQIERQAIDLGNMVTKITTNMKPILREKNLKFNVIITELLEPAMVSEELISDMMRNLLSNAVKYGGSDRVIDVELALESNRNGASDIVFKVTDYGFGIKEEHRDQIFKKFYRIKEYNTEEGTGLGLPHVKEIMRKHGGNIEVESTPEIGSRFIARIPYFPYYAQELS